MKRFISIFFVVFAVFMSVDVYADGNDCNPITEFFDPVIDSCVCNAGYYEKDEICTECEEGFYCKKGPNKFKCDNRFSHSEKQSTQSKDCYAKLTLNGGGGTVLNDVPSEMDGSVVVLRVKYLSDNKMSGLLSNETNTELFKLKQGKYLLDPNTDAGSYGAKFLNDGWPFSGGDMVFLGWYTTNDRSGKKVTIGQQFSGDKTLYARWGCKQGYYISGDECVSCDPGMTTAGVGATPKAQCKTAYTHSDDDGVWTWPAAVTLCTNPNCE